MTGIGDVRDASASRRLEWTGERMLPWIDDPAIAYEHLHRYAFAAQLVAGRRVLDIGSGEGYGAALLAAHGATDVVGLDVDAAAVAHARQAYPGVRFEQASAEDLSGFADASFDVVTCFEVVEHVHGQERLVAEARRVLAPDGILACSTPEREAYRRRTGTQNPFHVRELDMAEFRALLAGAFGHVALWSQTTVTGSLLVPLQAAAAGASTFRVARADGYWDLRAQPEPLYLVALASAAPLPPPQLSVLADPEQTLFVQQRDRAERAEQRLDDARVERAEAEERLLGYKAGMEVREAEVREQVAYADDLRTELLATGDRLAERERAYAALRAEIDELRRSRAHRTAEAARRLARRIR